jgi:hypothetical protein
MNTVREAQARVMPPATETAGLWVPRSVIEVAV